MTDIIIHKSKQYIKEDVDYYCSDIRDKHEMIKPSENLVSVSCDSNILSHAPSNHEISSIYYPFEKNTFHRIYIGISFPLFANNWGATFLRHLMYLVNKDGAVILPVYAERQGVEKNYWSRSSLEVMFQSRQKWWGKSNIWAENDGVMSMRIGKKEPPKKNSTLNYLFDYESNDIRKKDNPNANQIIARHHKNGTISAIVEQIMINYFGRKKDISYCDIHGDILLISEILMSDYITINSVTQIINDNSDITNIKKYLGEGFDKKMHIMSHQDKFPNMNNNFDVISMLNIFDNESEDFKKECIKKSLNNLNKDGILIIQDPSFNNKEFINSIISSISGLEYAQYSSIVATKHNKGTNIPHYSDIIFKELQIENDSRQNLINIIYKK